MWHMVNFLKQNKALFHSFSVEQQRNMTTVMHKNIICSFFPFITRHVRMSRVRSVEAGWAAHTGVKVQIFSEPLFLPGCITSHMLTDIHVVTHPPVCYLNVAHVDTPLSCMPPMQNLVVTPLACNLYCARYHVLFLHANNIPGFSTDITSVLFTLGTRWIPCYFRSTKVRHPPLHRQMSKGFSINI